MLNKYVIKVALRVTLFAIGLLTINCVGLFAGEGTGTISATAFVVEPVGAVPIDNIGTIEQTISDRPNDTFSKRHIQLAQILPMIPQTISRHSILMWTPAEHTFQIEVTADRNLGQSRHELLESIVTPLAPSVSYLSIPSLSVNPTAEDNVEYIVSIIYTEN